MKVTFLVPTYNESSTIVEVLDRLEALGLDRQIIVIDDGSTDPTGERVTAWAADHPDTLLLTKTNGGKGSALRTGIPHATGDVIVIQDADLETDPSEIPSLLEPIETGRADVVYGSRFLGGKPRLAYSFANMIGNRGITLFCDMLFGTTLTDIETAYKVFRREVMQSMPLREDGFGIDPELTGIACKRGLRICEVPVSYYGRTPEDGKKIHWTDGFFALKVLLRIRFHYKDRHVMNIAAGNDGGNQPVHTGALSE